MKNKIIKLSNGGRLVYRHSKLNKSTAVEVGFSVGANGDKKPGTAHFLEHTLFKKTKNRTNEKINRDRNKLAFLNASTGLDFLVVKFSRTNKLIEKAFEFASDVLLNSVLDDEFLESEKGVICEELKMTLDNQKRDIYTYNYSQAVSNVKQVCEIVGGTEDNIKNITFNDLVSFKKKHFVGNNFIISVVSSLSLSKIKKLAEKYFVSKIKFDKNYIKEKLYFEKKNVDKKSSLKFYDIEQEKISVLLSFRLDKNERDIYENNLNYPFLARYLSGAQGKLFLKLRNKGLVYSFGSDISCFSKSSLFNISFETSKDKIKSIIDELKTEVAELVSNEVEHNIVEEYKNNLIYKEDEKMPMSMIQNAHYNMIDVITTNRVFELNYKQKKQLISKINPADIKKAANDVFNKNTQMFVSVLGSADKKDIYSLAELKKYFLIGE